MHVKVMSNFAILWVSTRKELVPMLKQFTVRNFKCYGKQGATFDLSRITFIYGNNSVGKSSFLEALGILDKAQRNNSGLVIRGDGFKNGQIAAGDEWSLKCSDPAGNAYDWVLSCNRESQWILMDRETSERVLEPLYNQCIRSVDHVKAGEAKKKAESSFEALANGLENGQDEDGILIQDEMVDINEMFKKLNVKYSCAVDGTLTDLDFDMPNLKVDKVGAGIRGIYRHLKSIARWKTGLLLLEEPEANVNEGQLQKLAQLLVAVALSRGEKDANAQLVVECHSEHVLLEVLGMVADGKLKARDVSVTYVKKDVDGSKAFTCKIDGNGALDKWPDENGFFTARKRILFGENEEP